MLLQNKEEILQVIHLMTKDRFTNDQIRSIIIMVLFVVHKYDSMMKFCYKYFGILMNMLKES